MTLWTVRGRPEFSSWPGNAHHPCLHVWATTKWTSENWVKGVGGRRFHKQLESYIQRKTWVALCILCTVIDDIAAISGDVSTSGNGSALQTSIHGSRACWGSEKWTATLKNVHSQGGSSYKWCICYVALLGFRETIDLSAIPNEGLCSSSLEADILKRLQTIPNRRKGDQAHWQHEEIS